MSETLEVFVEQVLGRQSAEPFGAGKEPGEQGSVEWLMERVGCCTGSRFDDVVSKTSKGKASASRERYALDLVAERLLNRPGEHYFSLAMQWGRENEIFARQAYEARTGVLVEVPGFRKHGGLAWCGVSSDGLIDDDGTIEIKCPANPRNHIDTILNGMPSEHMAQVQGGLWVWGRAWSDFISFDPRMPAGLQIYVQRVPRNDAYIDMLEAEVGSFLQEVDRYLELLATRARAGAHQGEPA
jgi:hypothetical protein